MTFEKNDRIIFIGDSITDCNRDYQALPAKWASWGEGYVNLINAYTTGLVPELELMIVNKGVSGDRVTDLKNRWEKDVLALRPDWVSIMIGINDVWRHFDGTFSQDDQVSPSLFKQTLESIVLTTKDRTKGIFLLSAFMVENNPNDPMRKMVQTYNQITKELAEKYELIFIDIQNRIDHFLESSSSYVLSSDRVHPSLAGHMIIARTWLNATGLEGK